MEYPELLTGIWIMLLYAAYIVFYGQLLSDPIIRTELTPIGSQIRSVRYFMVSSGDANLFMGNNRAPHSFFSQKQFKSQVIFSLFHCIHLFQISKTGSKTASLFLLSGMEKLA